MSAQDNLQKPSTTPVASSPTPPSLTSIEDDGNRDRDSDDTESSIDISSLFSSQPLPGTSPLTRELMPSEGSLAGPANRVSGSLGAGPRVANYPPYQSMKYAAVTVGDGLAFNANRAADILAGNCSETTGSCLAHVANALEASGLPLRSSLRDRGGSHWAKDLSPVLQADQRFNQVAGGYGAGLDTSRWQDYKAQKGDICVWEGGEYGHVQMCVGEWPDGSPKWRSDFTAREGNWTGLREPGSHGNFRIFRQKTLDSSTTVASVDTKPHVTASTSHVSTTQPRPSVFSGAHV